MNRPIKKIGILTFHYAHNYGAMLQTYALKTYLTQQGYDVHVINYQNPVIAETYQKKLTAVSLVGRRALVFPWRWIDTSKRLLWAYFKKDDWENRKKKFEQFEEEYLLDTVDAPIAKEGLAEFDIDAWVFGSDQIWNTDIIGEDEEVYWGQFCSKAQKRIVYGASIHRTVLTPFEQENIAKCVRSFDAVSVREATLAEQVKEIAGHEVKAVVDPTLLILKESYERFVGTYDGEPYTLLYLAEDSSEADRAAKKTGLPVKTLGCRSNEPVCNVGPGKIMDAGPAEFINLISHATYVITKSFHGTVFSILFQRPFCVISGENARIDNLLRLAGLEEGRIPDASAFSPERFVQSTADTFQRLQSAIDFSKGYLANALGGDQGVGYQIPPDPPPVEKDPI